MTQKACGTTRAKKVPGELRVSALARAEEVGGTEAAREFGVQPATIRSWRRRVKAGHVWGEREPRRPPATPSVSPGDPVRLYRELKDLCGEAARAADRLSGLLREARGLPLSEGDEAEAVCEPEPVPEPDVDTDLLERAGGDPDRARHFQELRELERSRAGEENDIWAHAADGMKDQYLTWYVTEENAKRSLYVDVKAGRRTVRVGDVNRLSGISN